MPLVVTPMGPFTRGAIAAANSSLDMRGAARYIRHGILSGQGRLGSGRGSELALTLMDDQGTPAPCTSVCEVISFADFVLAVGHSTITDKTYLYRINTAFTGYYDNAGTFHAGLTAFRAHILWTAMPDPPVVTIAEVLGIGYIACTNAMNYNAFVYQTQKFTCAGGATAPSGLAAWAAGTIGNIYALGVFAFHGHIFGWGYDRGAVPAVAYRPELLRHGGPDGADFGAAGDGSFTVGHRIQSARERVVSVCVAGEVAYVGTTFSLWPIVGYGRDTWDKSHPLDDSYGFLTVKGNVSANGVLYYWSPRGPARVSGLNQPEPLWDPLADVVANIIDPHRIVAAYDADADQVLWFYRGGTASGNQLITAYDVRRDVMLGPDTDVGIQVACAGLVAPIVDPNAVPFQTAPGPAGPPTSPSTFFVGATIAFAAWQIGATGIGLTSVVEIRQRGTASWISQTEVAGTAEGCPLYGLAPNTAYEWRVAHKLNGQLSAWCGPTGATQFNTVRSPEDLLPPPPPPPVVAPTVDILPPTGLSVTNRGPAHAPEALVRWVNSGEADVSTEVYVDGGVRTTCGPGVASVALDVTESATIEVMVRHTKTGFSPSDFAGPVSAFIDDKP